MTRKATQKIYGYVLITKHVRWGGYIGFYDSDADNIRAVVTVCDPQGDVIEIPLNHLIWIENQEFLLDTLEELEKE